LIKVRIDKTQSSVFDLTGMWHYVVEGGARGGAKRMYIVYRTIYFMLD